MCIFLSGYVSVSQVVSVQHVLSIGFWLSPTNEFRINSLEQH